MKTVLIRDLDAMAVLMEECNVLRSETIDVIAEMKTILRRISIGDEGLTVTNNFGHTFR